jgi:Raf kinase inhibitor-like YbhB/YbcL family protein
MVKSRILLILALILITGCAQKEVEQMGELKLTSPVFENNGDIPSRYTCQGDNINPPLDIEGVPADAKSLVLIVDDPDAPMGIWVHWVVWNIKPTDKIKEDSAPGVQGVNDFGKQDYGGPCPPSGKHRYFFKLYALDTELDLDEGAHKKDVEGAMKGHILDKAEIVGLYEKK